MTLADDDVRFTLDHPFAFRTIDGEGVEVRVQRIDVSEQVTLHGQVDVATWERMYRSGAFHLDDQVAPTGWEADRPVDVLLRLRSPFASRHEVADEWLAEFTGSDDAPARHSEAWVLVEATQTLPVPGDPELTTSIGVRTSWAEALS